MILSGKDDSYHSELEKMISLKSFKPVLPHIAAILVMVGASSVYFFPEFQNKKIEMADAISGQQGAGELEHYSKDTGKYYLWSNGQFGGTPKLMFVNMYNNHILKIYNLFRLGFNEPIGMYLALMIFAYALFFFLGKEHIMACALAIVTSLSTSNVMLWSAGHYSKIGTLVFTPLIILGALLVFQKRKYILGGIVLMFSLGASLSRQHPQMTYYILIFFLVFGVVFLFDAFKKKTLRDFGIGLLVSIFASVIALGLTSTRMGSIYDYSKSSIRGEMVLNQDENLDVGENHTGLDWEYSMQWSNDLKDLTASFLIPGFVGGGSGEQVSVKSESFKKYKIKNAPLYWGDLPFTVGPMYIGVSLTFLFLLGIVFVEGKFKIWMVSGTVLMILLSMGKNFEFLSQLFFEHLPFYNKFRAPQSILSTVLFYLPALGILAINSIRKRSDKIRKSKKSSIGRKKAVINRKLFVTTGILCLPILLIAVFGSSVFSFHGGSDASYLAQGVDISPFISDRKSLLISDSWRSLIIVVSMSVLIWLLINKNFNQRVILLGLSAFVVFDICSVSTRYLNHDDFVKANKIDEAISKPRPVDLQILNSEPDRAKYRVQDLSVNTYNTSSSSYFYNTIGGYDPAKLRRYMDVIERHLNQGNMSVYNMLNTKYFITNEGGQVNVQTNPDALGNAWFVDKVVPVNTPNEEIDALNSIDPKKEAAVLLSDFKGTSPSLTFEKDTTATIELAEYEPTRLVYRTESTKEQLAVFSEIWYNGNRDWVSTIDGQKANHIRVNYILRGMVIPSGVHEVEFNFAPVVYARGEQISRISWWLFCLILIGGLGFELYKLRKNKIF